MQKNGLETIVKLVDLLSLFPCPMSSASSERFGHGQGIIDIQNYLPFMKWLNGAMHHPPMVLSMVHCGLPRKAGMTSSPYWYSPAFWA